MRGVLSTVRVAALLVVAGCAAGSAGSMPDRSDVLMHRVPDTNPVMYEFADTTRFTVQTGRMGAMEVVGAQRGTAVLTYQEEHDTLGVEIRIIEYDGRFENPGQGGTRASAADIGGRVIVRLDRRGVMELVRAPILAQAVRDLTGPETLARPFFPPLPGVPVDVGAAWVDTVRSVEGNGDAVTRSRSVVRSTLVGDTAIDGRGAWLIATLIATEVETAGMVSGVEVRQRVTGELRGRVAWDPRRHLMVERHEEGALEGTLELPATGEAGLPITGRYVRSIRLRD